MENYWRNVKKLPLGVKLSGRTGEILKIIMCMYVFQFKKKNGRDTGNSGQ